MWNGDWMAKAYAVSEGDWVSVWLLDITTFIQCKIKKEIKKFGPPKYYIHAKDCFVINILRRKGLIIADVCSFKKNKLLGPHWKYYWSFYGHKISQQNCRENVFRD
jgi:hypothetical protein